MTNKINRLHEERHSLWICAIIFFKSYSFISINYNLVLFTHLNTPENHDN